MPTDKAYGRWLGVTKAYTPYAAWQAGKRAGMREALEWVQELPLVTRPHHSKDRIAERRRALEGSE